MYRYRGHRSAESTLKAGQSISATLGSVHEDDSPAHRAGARRTQENHFATRLLAISGGNRER